MNVDNRNSEEHVIAQVCVTDCNPVLARVCRSAVVGRDDELVGSLGDCAGGRS